MIHVQVLFFSVVKERLGQDKYQMDFSEIPTGTDLLNELETRFPALKPFRPFIRLAVNQTYVAENILLADGDEVAIITPVSGG
jgi:molybdopterin converting factor subunit 1